MENKNGKKISLCKKLKLIIDYGIGLKKSPIPPYQARSATISRQGMKFLSYQIRNNKMASQTPSRNNGTSSDKDFAIRIAFNKTNLKEKQ